MRTTLTLRLAAVVGGLGTLAWTLLETAGYYHP